MRAVLSLLSSVPVLVFVVGCAAKKTPPAAPVETAADHAPAAPVETAAARAPSGAATVGEASVWLKLAPAPGKLHALVRAEVAKAKQRSWKPVVYLSAAWCRPCNAIKKSRQDPRMLEALRGTYVVEVDADDWPADELIAQGLKDGKIPFFYLVDDEGLPTGAKLTSSAWDEDIPENMAPVLKKFFASK
jgi:hypothetical protein